MPDKRQRCLALQQILQSRQNLAVREGETGIQQALGAGVLPLQEQDGHFPEQHPDREGRHVDEHGATQRLRQRPAEVAVACVGRGRNVVGTFQYRLEVAKDRTPEVATQVLARFNVTDLSVEDPPIEQVIAQVFAAS